MERTALIVLDGNPCSRDLALAIAERSEFVACADGSFNWFSEYDIKVDAIVGDLDSVAVPAGNNILKVPDESQDDTDFEKTIKFLKKKRYDQILVLGGTGKEQDHFLSNLTITAKYGRAARIILIDDLHRMLATRVVSGHDNDIS